MAILTDASNEIGLSIVYNSKIMENKLWYIRMTAPLAIINKSETALHILSWNKL